MSEHMTPVNLTDYSGYLSGKSFLQFCSGAMIVIGAVLTITGVGTVAGLALIGAGVGSLAGGEISESMGGSYETGWLVGGLIGTIGGAYSAPFLEGAMLSNVTLSYSLGSGALSYGTITAVQGIGVASGAIGIDVMYFASKNRPGNNRKQNEQFRSIMKKYKITNKDLIRQIHNDLHKVGPMGYKALEEFIKSFIGD